MSADDTHPEIHRELSDWYQARAGYYGELAAYHAIKAANPLCEIPIPEKPEKCNSSKIGIDV